MGKITKIRIVSILTLLYFCGCCVLLGIILSIGLPRTHLIQGPNLTYVPFIIAALQLLAVVFSIFLGRRVNPPPLKSPTSLRWALLFVGVMVLFCGYVIINMSIFVPHLFGSEYSVPQIGVVSWLVMSLILALILYFTSKLNSVSRPNLFRYFALIIAFIAGTLTLIQCLIFIYAMPVQPPTAFPFLSGLMTVAFIPYALLLLGLSKDHISMKKAGYVPEQN